MQSSRLGLLLLLLTAALQGLSGVSVQAVDFIPGLREEERCVAHPENHTETDTVFPEYGPAVDTLRSDSHQAAPMPLTGLDADSITSRSDSITALQADNRSDWWWTQIRNGTWNIYDTTVRYPRFIGFCVDVYRWVDKVFNSYDPDYIESPPQKWKVMLKSDNWLDSYAMVFNGDIPVWLLSDMTCTLGAYLQFMAVSVGYSLDMSNIIGNRPSLHKKTEFSFSTGRFYIEGQYTSNTEGSVLRRFGPYGKDRLLDMTFPGLDFKSYGLTGYYFLNCHKYSQGATYNFSKIQRRSAGSLMFGFAFTNSDIDVDFTSLPEYMLTKLEGFPLKYKFRYNAFNFLIGYGYNWVFARNFVFNITALPGVGWKHCFPECSGGERDMWSLDFMGRMGVTYNISDCFLGLGSKVDGAWFRGDRFNFFNFTLQVAFTAGVRF